MNKCPVCKAELETIYVRKIIRPCWGNMLHYGDDIMSKCTACEYKTNVKRTLTRVGEYYQLPWYKRICKSIPENCPNELF